MNKINEIWHIINNNIRSNCLEAISYPEYCRIYHKIASVEFYEMKYLIAENIPFY